MKRRMTALFMTGIMIFMTACSGGNDKTGSNIQDGGLVETGGETIKETAAAGGSITGSGTVEAVCTTAENGASAAIDLSLRSYSLEFPEYNENYDYEEWDASDATMLTLSGTSYSAEGKHSSGINQSGDILTISEKGTYVLSGNYDGQIRIEVSDEENVKLIFNGVNITSSDGPAIYAVNAKNLYISLEEGSENVISDSSNYTLEDGVDEPDAAIFAKCDLIFRGSGKLTVNGNYSGAVRSKDELVFRNGSYDITAASDALKGKDGLYVYDGLYTINAGGKGLAATNNTEGEEADLYIEGGSFDITSGEDAIHCNANVIIVGGSFDINASDDGIHADKTVLVYGSTVNIEKSNEGIEGAVIDLTGSDITLKASDDGLNAAGDVNETEEDADEKHWNFMEGNESNIIYIDGGNIYVNADGDGVDSNGYIYMYAGNMTVDGPVNDGNGFLDYGLDFVMTGGTFTGAGSTGMLQTIADSSTVKAVMVGTGSKEGGTEISLKDSDGNVIVSYTPVKSFSGVLFAGYDFDEGDTVEAYAGNESLGSVKIENTVNTIGDVKTMGGGHGGMGGGFMGGKGGMRGNGAVSGNEMQGNPPEGMTPPDGNFENGERPEMPEGMTPPEGGFQNGEFPNGEFKEGNFQKGQGMKGGRGKGMEMNEGN